MSALNCDGCDERTMSAMRCDVCVEGIERPRNDGQIIAANPCLCLYEQLTIEENHQYCKVMDLRRGGGFLNHIISTQALHICMTALG